jgi:hypothetical protein
MEATMTEPDATEQDDVRLQVDPVLTLSGGTATVGQKLFGAIVAIAAVAGTLYGLTHQRGDVSRSVAISAIDGAFVPRTLGPAR